MYYCRREGREEIGAGQYSQVKWLLKNEKSKVVTNLQIMNCLSSGGVCGRAVNTSNSGSGGPGFKPLPLCCFRRQGTLLHFVSLHPSV